MSRYKLVVSDLHVSRGRLLADGSINVLEDFHADQPFKEFLEFYTNGKYYESDVELILNGDILNLIQVDYRGYHSPILTEAMSAEKLEGVIKGHPVFFDALKKFAQLPKKKVTYVVGNHDIEMVWPKCQRIFSEAVGTTVDFKVFDYVFDGVHVEHGHQRESINGSDIKRLFLSKGLKEPIINLPWGSHFVINFVIPMKQEEPAIDKVRPIQAMARWTMLTRPLWFCKTMLRIFAYFIGTRFSKSMYRTTNLVTSLKILKEMTKPFPLVEIAHDILNDDHSLHTVIMGHTHSPKYKQYPDGREYLNSGTWTEVTSLDLSTLGKHTRYNYIIIDYTLNPQRPHAQLKQWNGRWHEDQV